MRRCIRRGYVGGIRGGIHRRIQHVRMRVQRARLGMREGEGEGEGEGVK